jgi:hypothetical protein
VSKREAHGIMQTDILVRTAIIEALRRLRNDPRLFDSIFENLRNDPLTAKEYGDTEIAAAKLWFFGGDGKGPVDIPVLMSYRVVPGDYQFPCISVALMESTEAEQTHGDVHYQPKEAVEADWPPIAGPFTPDEYAASSGIAVLPADVIGAIVLMPGMSLIDRAGKAHLIMEVLDDYTVSIAAGTVADFRNAFLKGCRPRLAETIESVNMRETYQLGVHVQGESFNLTYLHAIVQFSLLHYKQDLLEHRGLERTSIGSSEFLRTELFGKEIVFSRGISVTGYVRQIWPKKTTPVVDAFTPKFVMEKPDSPTPVPTEGDPDALWVAQSD